MCTKEKETGISTWKNCQVMTLKNGLPGIQFLPLYKDCPDHAPHDLDVAKSKCNFSTATFLNSSIIFNTLDCSNLRYFLLPASVISHSPAFLVALYLVGYHFINSFLDFSPSQNLRMLICVTTFLFLLYIYTLYMNHD